MNLNYLFNEVVPLLSTIENSELDLIKIEKQLKLNSRLNQDKNSNEVDSTLTILKANKKGLIELSKDKFLINFLYKNNFNPKGTKILSLNSETLDACSFINSYLGIQFLDSIKHYINSNQFHILKNLNKYSEFLDYELISNIEYKLEEKLESGIAILKGKTDLSKSKPQIENLISKDFYKVLTIFNDYNIESKILELLIFIRNEKDNKSWGKELKNFIYKIGSSIINYESYDENTTHSIKINYCESKLKYIRDIIDEKGELKHILLLPLEIAFAFFIRFLELILLITIKLLVDSYFYFRKKFRRNSKKQKTEFNFD